MRPDLRIGQRLRRSLMGLGLCVAAAAPTPIALAQAPIPVRVGVLADMSGLFSDIGGQGAAEATRMAVEDFRKLPGAERFAVDVVAADAQNKPDVSSAIARK